MNVKTLCLGILTLREASGYEIKKMVEDGMFSHFIICCDGSIYPAWTQMLNEDLLTVRARNRPDGPTRRSTPSPPRGGTGRARRSSRRRRTASSRSSCSRCCWADIDLHHIAQVFDAQLAHLAGELSRRRDLFGRGGPASRRASSTAMAVPCSPRRLNATCKTCATRSSLARHRAPQRKNASGPGFCGSITYATFLSGPGTASSASPWLFAGSPRATSLPRPPRPKGPPLPKHWRSASAPGPLRPMIAPPPWWSAAIPKPRAGWRSGPVPAGLVEASRSPRATASRTAR